MSETSKQRESREYFRVRTRLRVGLRTLTPAEAEEIAREITQREPGYGTRIDFELAEWLARIERKLDIVLRKLGAEAESGVLPSEELDIVISGNGLLVPNDGSLSAAGQHVLVELHLPGTPLRPVRAQAVVVAHAAGDSRELVPLALRVIHEADRDSIIRHCIAVERRNLRQHSVSAEDR